VAGPLSNLGLFLSGIALRITVYGMIPWAFFFTVQCADSAFQYSSGHAAGRREGLPRLPGGRIGVRDATYIGLLVLGQILSVVMFLVGASGLLLGLAGLNYYHRGVSVYTPPPGKGRRPLPFNAAPDGENR
jgi:hypothetical protein